jgi:hypothetical protein
MVTPSILRSRAISKFACGIRSYTRKRPSHGLRKYSIVIRNGSAEKGKPFCNSTLWPCSITITTHSPASHYWIPPGNSFMVGNPIETHYYSGAIIGIAIPLSFSGFLSGEMTVLSSASRNPPRLHPSHSLGGTSSSPLNRIDFGLSVRVLLRPQISHR